MATFSRTRSASRRVPVASRSPQFGNLPAPFCLPTALRPPAVFTKCALPPSPRSDQLANRSTLTPQKLEASAVGAGTPGPALNHENYETNPKQFLRSLFKCNGFARFWWFFGRRNEPQTAGSPGPDARISGFICVPLWLKCFHAASLKPLKFAHQNLREPQQNPASSSPVNPKKFLGPPPLPGLPPDHPGNGEPRGVGIVRRGMECGDMSPLSHWQTCLPVPKRGHVRALHAAYVRDAFGLQSAVLSRDAATSPSRPPIFLGLHPQSSTLHPLSPWGPASRWRWRRRPISLAEAGFQI